MSVFWIPVVAIVATFGMIIIVAMAGAKTRQRQIESQANVQLKLIDRFGTADDFVNFIKSDEGKQFLGDAPKVRRKYIGGIWWGILSMFVGLAFVACAIAEHDGDFLIPAFLFLFLGAGFFVATVISMRLVRDMEKNDGQ